MRDDQLPPAIQDNGFAIFNTKEYIFHNTNILMSTYQSINLPINYSWIRQFEYLIFSFINILDGIHRNILKYTGIYWNTLEYAGIYWNVLKYTGKYWNKLEYTGIYWNILEYTGIYWNTLKYTRIFINILKYFKFKTWFLRRFAPHFLFTILPFYCRSSSRHCLHC